jgi:hypothetical protein
VRALIGAALAALASIVSAQQPAVNASSATAPRTDRPSAGITEEVARLRRDPNAIPMPPADSFVVGGRTVRAGERLASAAVAGGPLDIYGTVDGNVVALDGDIVLHPGAHVRGDAMAVRGEVRLEGGILDGERRTLQGTTGLVVRHPVTPQLTPLQATLRALKISLGWLAMLLVIGVGVLVYAGPYLDGVTDTLERNPMRALWTGMIGQLAILPALLLLVVALALTILGILLIPFGVVAFVLVVAGILTLGFLAVAQVTGRALFGGRARAALTERGAALRALFAGTTAALSLWVLAALFTAATTPGAVLRGLAFAVTWVAATAGFGAAIISRGGTRREAMAPAAPALPMDSLAWQTPTPVAGIVAARRPTPATLPELKQ